MCTALGMTNKSTLSLLDTLSHTPSILQESGTFGGYIGLIKWCSLVPHLIVIISSHTVLYYVTATYM